MPRKKDVNIVVDSWLSNGIKTLRILVEKGKVDREMFTAAADEIEKIQKDWRHRRRDEELN